MVTVNGQFSATTHTLFSSNLLDKGAVIMVRLVIVLVILGLFLAGCGNSVNSFAVNSFEGEIHKVEKNRFA